jgi:hypothetical protein
VITWAIASLAADSSTSVQLVVTATQTITHDDYRATADGNLSAVGEVPVVTAILPSPDFSAEPLTGTVPLSAQPPLGDGHFHQRLDQRHQLPVELRGWHH